MFTLTRLLATLGALVVVPTISYVMGQTMETPPPPPPPPAMQQQGGIGGPGGFGQGQSGGQGQFEGKPNEGGQPYPGMGGGSQGGGQGFPGPGGQPNPGMMGNQFGNFQNNNKDFKMGQPNNTRCPMGEFWGKNDQGRESCIRGGNQGNMGSGNGTQGMMPGDKNDGRFMKGTGGPGQGQGSGMGGPSDEDFKKMEEKQEKQEQEQEQRQLKQMKQGMGRAVQPLKMMQTQIKRLEAQKITVPSDIKEFVRTIEQALSSVQSATTFDDAQQAMETMQDAQQDFEDHFQTIQKLGNWKRIQSQSKSDIRRLESMLKRAQANAKRKGALDMSDPLNELSDAIIGLKATVEKSNALMTEGKADDALDLMENDFFGKMDDSQDIQQTLDILGNLSGYLRKAPAELKRMKADMSRLKRGKISTEEADDLLTQMERKLAEVKTLAAAKPIDTDALIDAVDDGSKLMEEFQELRDKLAGATSSNDALFDVNEKSIPKFELPPSR